MHTPNALAHSYFSDPKLFFTARDRKALVKFLKDENERLVIAMGIHIYWCDEDPYKDFAEMQRDFTENRRLKVYGGGTSSPLLTEWQNFMFRAVHDAHHLSIGADFTLEGEIKAFQHAASLTHNETLKRFFFSEIVLQAATFYATGTFPEQRIVDSPLMSHYLTRG